MSHDILTMIDREEIGGVIMRENMRKRSKVKVPSVSGTQSCVLFPVSCSCFTEIKKPKQGMDKQPCQNVIKVWDLKLYFQKGTTFCAIFKAS